MKKVCSKLFILSLLYFSLISCNSNAKLILVDDVKFPDVSNKECTWAETISQKGIRKLRRNRVIFKTEENINVKLVFKGCNGDFVGLVNCHRGFQAKKYLAFKMHSNFSVYLSFNIEDIYMQLRIFYDANSSLGYNFNTMWEEVLSIITHELFKENNQLNFP